MPTFTFGADCYLSFEVMTSSDVAMGRWNVPLANIERTTVELRNARETSTIPPNTYADYYAISKLRSIKDSKNQSIRIIDYRNIDKNTTSDIIFSCKSFSNGAHFGFFCRDGYTGGKAIGYYGSYGVYDKCIKSTSKKDNSKGGDNTSTQGATLEFTTEGQVKNVWEAVWTVPGGEVEIIDPNGNLYSCKRDYGSVYGCDNALWLKKITDNKGKNIPITVPYRDRKTLTNNDYVEIYFFSKPIKGHHFLYNCSTSNYKPDENPHKPYYVTTKNNFKLYSKCAPKHTKAPKTDQHSSNTNNKKNNTNNKKESLTATLEFKDGYKVKNIWHAMWAPDTNPKFLDDKKNEITDSKISLQDFYNKTSLSNLTKITDANGKNIKIDISQNMDDYRGKVTMINFAPSLKEYNNTKYYFLFECEENAKQEKYFIGTTGSGKQWYTKCELNSNSDNNTSNDNNADNDKKNNKNNDNNTNNDNNADNNKKNNKNNDDNTSNDNKNKTTTKKITATVTDRILTYNGTQQSCANVVVESPTDAQISYSTEQNGLYTDDIVLTDAGTITVWYKVEKTDYETLVGHFNCTMNKAPGFVTIKYSETTITDNLVIDSHPFNETLTALCAENIEPTTVTSSNPGIATASLSGTDITLTTVNTGNSVITVDCPETKNYSAASASFTLTVNQTQPEDEIETINGCALVFQGGDVLGNIESFTDNFDGNNTFKYANDGVSESQQSNLSLKDLTELKVDGQNISFSISDILDNASGMSFSCYDKRPEFCVTCLPGYYGEKWMGAGCWNKCIENPDFARIAACIDDNGNWAPDSSCKNLDEFATESKCEPTSAANYIYTNAKRDMVSFMKAKNKNISIPDSGNGNIYRCDSIECETGYSPVNGICLPINHVNGTEIRPVINAKKFDFVSLDNILDNYFVKSSVWRNEQGKFNTARLASDSIAGAVLGTVGGVITSKVVKNNQIKKGFESLKCTISGQDTASYGDEFKVDIIK